MSERIEKLKEFLKASPKDSFLNHALALEYVKLGQDEDARKLFDVNVADDVRYVASYYHLGKLLERVGATQEAITIYEKGMVAAKEAKDMHTYNELQGAYEDIVD
jgi:tetratricopeptide (TPR) repeat protein